MSDESGSGELKRRRGRPVTTGKTPVRQVGRVPEHEWQEIVRAAHSLQMTITDFATETLLERARQINCGSEAPSVANIADPSSHLLVGFDPKAASDASKVAAKAVKAGIYTFAEFVPLVQEQLGTELTRKIGDYLIQAWTAAGKITGGKVDAPRAVNDLLRQPKH